MCEDCRNFRNLFNVETDVETREKTLNKFNADLDNQKSYPKLIRVIGERFQISSEEEEREVREDFKLDVELATTPKEEKVIFKKMVEIMLGNYLPVCKESYKYFVGLVIARKIDSIVLQSIKTKNLEEVRHRTDIMIDRVADYIKENDGNQGLKQMMYKDILHASLRRFAPLPIAIHDIEKGEINASSVVALSISGNREVLASLHKACKIPSKNEALFSFIMDTKDMEFIDHNVESVFLFNLYESIFGDSSTERNIINGIADLIPLNGVISHFVQEKYGVSYDYIKEIMHYVNFVFFCSLYYEEPKGDSAYELNISQICRKAQDVLTEKYNYGYPEDLNLADELNEMFFDGGILVKDKFFPDYLIFNEYCRERMKDARI